MNLNMPLPAFLAHLDLPWLAQCSCTMPLKKEPYLNVLLCKDVTISILSGSKLVALFCYAIPTDNTLCSCRSDVIPT